MADSILRAMATGYSTPARRAPPVAAAPTRRWPCGCARARLDELVGQEHVLGRGRRCGRRSRAAPAQRDPLRAAGGGEDDAGADRGGGADGAFEEESAVNAGKAEIRSVIERARERRQGSGRPTILFLDEIHRFNKAQQDALLPAVEEGLLTLIGATTENPYFEVNSALLSRCQIYELQPLEPEQVEELLRRALADPERGIADPPPVEDAALEMLAHALRRRRPRRALRARAGGRAREGAAVGVAAIEDALQRKAVDYDRQGDRHYDFISAWIKATRGSDVDASLYYLAVMLEGGEDPRFIARRMVILASEDVGNADPQALLVADAAARAVDRVGLPECALNLAQACVYLALAPKSNASYKALGAARAEIRANGARTPPDYLRDAHYPGAEKTLRDDRLKAPSCRRSHRRVRARRSTMRRLSQRRAQSVTAFLLPAASNRTRISAVGMGKTHPRNANPYDPINRRVEMRINQ